VVDGRPQVLSMFDHRCVSTPVKAAEPFKLLISNITLGSVHMIRVRVRASLHRFKNVIVPRKTFSHLSVIMVKHPARYIIGHSGDDPPSQFPDWRKRP